MKGIYREKNKFYQDITVPCYDVDSSRYLKPASFMDMAQELAHWAAELLGAGFDVLARKKTAWVLSRMHIHFGDAPEWREDIRLWTWHKGFDGLFFLRDFSLRDESGRERVTATSSWIIIDTEYPIQTLISSAIPTTSGIWYGQWTALISRRLPHAGRRMFISITTERRIRVRPSVSSASGQRAQKGECRFI